MYCISWDKLTIPSLFFVVMSNIRYSSRATSCLSVCLSVVQANMVSTMVHINSCYFLSWLKVKISIFYPDKVKFKCNVSRESHEFIVVLFPMNPDKLYLYCFPWITNYQRFVSPVLLEMLPPVGCCSLITWRNP